jgi:hypothetical protein
MPSRINRGDAEAVLNAFANGGWAVLLHTGEAMEASPADWYGSHGSALLRRRLACHRHGADRWW